MMPMNRMGNSLKLNIPFDASLKSERRSFELEATLVDRVFVLYRVHRRGNGSISAMCDTVGDSVRHL